MMNKDTKGVSQVLLTNISVKYINRVLEKSRSHDYAEGYTDGIRDMMEVLNDYVKSAIEEQFQVDKVKPKEETDTEQIVADFFRRIS